MNNYNILILIVSYGIKIEECIAYNSLIAFIKKIPQIKLFIFNNFPQFEIKSQNGEFVFNSDSNKKLSGAYNFTYNFAKKNKIDWIVLLDQDTILSEEYLTEIVDFVDNPKDYEIAIPVLVKNGKVLSPFKYNINKGPFAQNFDVCKVNKMYECVTAFNSGVVIKVSLIDEFGGFSDDFPLDYLDYWYFKKIYELRKKVYVLNSKIEHSLSLLNMSKEMSIDRYKNFMNAENDFVKIFSSKVMFYYKLRLIVRIFKQLFVIKSLRHAFVTFRFLFAR